MHSVNITDHPNCVTGTQSPEQNDPQPCRIYSPVKICIRLSHTFPGEAGGRGASCLFALEHYEPQVTESLCQDPNSREIQ